MRDGENGSWKMFLKSLNEQNYSNYRVYMMDDFSSDNSTATILKEVPNYPRLNNRIWIIKNKERIGALGNRDSVTRNFCQPGEIVMDIDGDDALIGKQALNLFNRFYTHNESNWLVYTNFLAMKGD
jgi:glycosyltransferase involved in cell wall biosynthesis